MRRHFLAHRWVWLAIALTVVVANELLDRNFFDHREHIDGDVVLTLLVLLVSFFGSFLVQQCSSVAAHRRHRRAGRSTLQDSLRTSPAVNPMTVGAVAGTRPGVSGLAANVS